MPTLTDKKLLIILNLQDDDADIDNPFDCDEFSMVTFNMNNRFDGAMPPLDPAKLGKTWWPLSCYRHSGEHWYLAGTGGYECQWDTRKNAGVLFIKSGDESDVDGDPTEYAARFMEIYNKWLSGDCWRYDISMERMEEVGGPCPTCHSDHSYVVSVMEQIYDSSGHIGLEQLIKGLRCYFKSMKERMPSVTDLYKVEVVGDDSGKCYFTDVKIMLCELGFKIEGEE